MAKVELNESQKEALRLSKVTDAFRKVFGFDDASRTDAQRTVWNELRLMSYRDKPSFVADKKTGAVCPLRAALTDGRRALFCDIEANVNFAPLIEEQQPQQKR